MCNCSLWMTTIIRFHAGLLRWLFGMMYISGKYSKQKFKNSHFSCKDVCCDTPAVYPSGLFIKVLTAHGLHCCMAQWITIIIIISVSVTTDKCMLSTFRFIVIYMYVSKMCNLGHISLENNQI